MTVALRGFNKNTDSVKQIDAIYQYFASQLTAVDLSEILRAEYVLIISAFDCYIHDVVREGMIEIFNGARNSNKNYNEFRIPLEIVGRIIVETDDNIKKSLLDSAIKKVSSKDSYQAPSSVEDALNILSIKKIWTKVGNKIGMSGDDVKQKLGLFVRRRNEIAHQADINILTGTKNNIEHNDIIEILDFIDKLVRFIDEIVEQER